MIKQNCRELTVLEVTPFGQSRGEDGEPLFFELRLTSPEWEMWRPGQFVMLRPHGLEPEALWARAFSIAWADQDTLRVCIQIAGRATKRMARLKPGEKVTTWGPLGNVFMVEPDTPTLILAGGIGIAPFMGYVRNHPKPENLRMVFGLRREPECYPFDFFSDRIRSDCFVECSPEDLERFIALLQERMEEVAPKGLVLCCGPTPLMRTVQRLAKELNVRTQVSLETRMVCGVGACLSCVAKDPEGRNLPTCSKGPIFWAHKVDLSGC